MPKEEKILKNIEKLGYKYIKVHLSYLDKDKLETDWWEAMKFFFSRSFARGRRDKLSNEYKTFAVSTIENFFNINEDSIEESHRMFNKYSGYFDKQYIVNFKENSKFRNCIKDPNFEKEVASKNDFIKMLVTEKKIKIEWDGKSSAKNKCLNFDLDLMMVLDVLKYASKNEVTVYSYLNNLIAKKGTRVAYDELVQISGIHDKIASFILRDIGLLNPGLINGEFEYAFPIDTWVNQVSHKLGCTGKIQDVKCCLIRSCQEYKINPLHFAAGLWCLGANSFDLLMKHFGEIEI